MRFKVFIRKSVKNARRAVLGLINLGYRTNKFRFPVIVTKLIGLRAWQRISYPRARPKPMPKNVVLLERRQAPYYQHKGIYDRHK